MIWYYDMMWCELAVGYIIFGTVQVACSICQCYSCLVTIQSDVNCTTKWVRQNAYGSGRKNHNGASTLLDCQKVCEFDPHCVAIDWLRNDQPCYLNTYPNHNHSRPSVYHHYDLVSRCDITSGQSLSKRNSSGLQKQESWAIAKATGWCAQYMGALKNFESPD